MDKVVTGTIGVQGFRQNWQLKWPSDPVTHLTLNWQLTSLVSEVRHNNQF